MVALNLHIHVYLLFRFLRALVKKKKKNTIRSQTECTLCRTIGGNSCVYNQNTLFASV